MYVENTDKLGFSILPMEKLKDFLEPIHSEYYWSCMNVFFNNLIINFDADGDDIKLAVTNFDCPFLFTTSNKLGINIDVIAPDGDQISASAYLVGVHLTREALEMLTEKYGASVDSETLEKWASWYHHLAIFGSKLSVFFDQKDECEKLIN